MCNLASINVAKVNTQADVERITALVTRCLDNVIDLNFYPIKEAELTSNTYRPIGIGTLGVAELLATKQIAYDTKEAVEYVGGLYEMIACEVYINSALLAKERGVYNKYS